MSDIIISATATTQTIRTQFTYDAAHLGRKLTETLYRRRSASDPTLVALTTRYQDDYLDRAIRVTDPSGLLRGTGIQSLPIDRLYVVPGTESGHFRRIC